MLVVLCFLRLALAYLGRTAPVDVYETVCYRIAHDVYDFGRPCPTLNQTTQLSAFSCPCNDYRFLETIVNCIDRITKNHTSANYVNLRNNSINRFAKVCNINSERLLDYLHNTTELPNYDGIRRGSLMTIKSAFAMTDKEINDGYMALTRILSRENYNMRYGSALLAYWGGVCLISTVFNILSMFSPGATRVLHRSALAQNYQQYLGYFSMGFRSVKPLDLMIVSGFLVLSVVFLFVELGVWYPDFTTLYSDQRTFNLALGIRSGVLSLYILPLIILFAGRNNLLIWLTGWPHDRFFLFHRWIARVEVFYVFMHAVSYSVAFKIARIYHVQQYYDYWILGGAGMFFGAVLLAHSWKWIRNYAYYTFTVTHILFAILYLAMGFWHLKRMYQVYALNFFYVSFVVWALDWCIKLGYILSSGLCGRSDKTSFGISAKVQLHKHVLKVKLDRPVRWGLATKPGKIVYVRFIIGWHSFQSHPFLITNDCLGSGGVCLFSTIHGYLMKYMAQHTLDKGHLVEQLSGYVSSANCYELPVKILLEGPYGHSLKLSTFEEVTFVVEDAGIISAYAYIDDILNHRNESSEISHVTLIWKVKSRDERWFDTELKYLATQSLVDVRVLYTNEAEPGTNGYDSAIAMLNRMLVQVDRPTAIVSCGPAPLNLAAEESARAAMSKRSHVLRYFANSYEA